MKRSKHGRFRPRSVFHRDVLQFIAAGMLSVIVFFGFPFINNSVAGDEPSVLRTNLLQRAWNADRSKLTFSWGVAQSRHQSGYRVSVYPGEHGSLQASAVFVSGWVQGSNRVSVHFDDLAGVLSDNTVYSWQVEVRYDDGAVATSDPCPFATALGDEWVSQELAWTPASQVSALVRATVDEPKPTRALLSVTALDTEAAQRHVYNVYVNGQEMGVGPNRRAGNTVYYNTFDVTDALNNDGSNVLGLYAYSAAETTGVLMQLTYFDVDGNPTVVYNSGRDAGQTQTWGMDAVMYTNAEASIGTQYYTERAQNAQVDAFPFGWATGEESDSSGWDDPRAVQMPQDYALAPSITANTVRTEVAPAGVKPVSGKSGTFTVTWPKEIIGDIQLKDVSVSGNQVQPIRITMGEELDGQVAKYPLRTGNTYDETWTFPADSQHVDFSGYSLKAFRYVTVENYPGTLTLDGIQGLQTSIPATAVSSPEASWQTGSDMLDDIYELVDYSQQVTTLDTIPDSVTRERRPYEGDLLIYQDLTNQLGRDPLPARNTWNYLLANPTQYTEYRLMAVQGVYQDYQATHDEQYVADHYAVLTSRLDATVTFDEHVGLVSSNDGVDVLVDPLYRAFPDSDLDNTKYITVVNAVAYGSYLDMAALARVVGNEDDADRYEGIAQTIKQTLNERVYDSQRHLYADGQVGGGTTVEQYSHLSTYFALAYGLAPNADVGRSSAIEIAGEGWQKEGDVYNAYFFYRGLYAVGAGDLATAVLERTDDDDIRTYAYMLNKLHATIAPEAWSPEAKRNMTFSHVWGAGGGAAMIYGLGGFSATGGTDAGANTVFTLIATGRQHDTVSTKTPSQWGTLSSTLSREGEHLMIQVTVPSAVSVEVLVPEASTHTRVMVDGVLTQIGIFNGQPAVTLSTLGEHIVILNNPD